MLKLVVGERNGMIPNWTFEEARAIENRLQDWALEQGATQQDLDDSQSRHGEGMARAKHIARVERKLGRGAHARLTHAQQCVLEACRVVAGGLAHLVAMHEWTALDARVWAEARR